MTTHYGSADWITGPSSFRAEGRVFSKLQQILSESDETLDDEVRGSISEFFKNKIEEITGLRVESVEDFVRDNTPGHLYDYAQFITEVIQKALEFFL